MHRESPQINARLACICTACRRHAHWGGCGVDSHTLCGSRMNRVLCGTVWKCEGVERGVASAVSKHPLPSRSSGRRRPDANADTF